ncbi:MAG: glycoside hydrolase family 140 protein [Bryobacteraceae bacterium]|nr:glycoside hydrolase family 140 protein [Bryobacteraceae bacterium]
MRTSILAICWSMAAAWAQRPAALPKLSVDAGKRFLVSEKGEAFFWLGDTAWELFHRANRQEAIDYLDIRASQGYNVVQIVALAEFDGVKTPNAFGDLPLTGYDPSKPAVTPGANPKNAAEYDYWDHVDFIVDEANRRGIYVGFLPTWASWAEPNRGEPAILTVENSVTYGEFLGKRYGKKGVIWVLGGDRIADGREPLWRSLAKGIAIGVAGKEDYSAVLMTFHPRGGLTSSKNFHNDEWLDFNMHQTGHGLSETVKPWDKIAKDYALQPVKPVMDGEPLYEDHPLAFRAAVNGYSLDAHVRQRVYWDIFSGAFGVTYGNHSVWQMFSPEKRPVNGPILTWRDALRRPGAEQMKYLKALIESRPMLSRVPDQSLVADTLDNVDKIVATRGDGYALIYTAQGRKFTVNLGKISGGKLKAHWFNPRSGGAWPVESVDNRGTKEFLPPAEGFSADWVLVLDDEAKGYGVPGQGKAKR